MKDIRLPASGHLTSALGFGCAYLVGGWETRQNLRLVDMAFDLGYRHFDVAPAYGLGTAQEVLGKALQSRRAQVTLASKIGIGRPRYGSLLLTVRHALKPLRRLPVSRALGQKAYSVAAPTGQFDIGRIEQSLHDSLRALKTDYLDLLLLHEVASTDLTDELLSTLARFRRDGKVLGLGTATTLAETEIIRSRYGSAFDVWQHAFNLFEMHAAAFAPFTILHSPLQWNLAKLGRRLAEAPDFAPQLSRHLDLDLTDQVCLSRVLIGSCLAANAGGMTLTGSRQSQRIHDNAAVLHDARWVEAGSALNAFLKSGEGQSFLAPALAPREARS